MDWKTELAQSVTTMEQLQEYFPMTREEQLRLQQILERYPMRIPRYYLSLIDPEHPREDPIYRMCVPSLWETDLSGSFDTSGEGSNTVLRGVQHKYSATALILSTSRCAMYCRHCFRKRLVGLDEEAESVADLDAAASYVRAHREISNVLISGGDAFLNSNRVIEQYLERFSEIDHLDLIRFGTRTPVTLPSRITGDRELYALLSHYGQAKQIYVITQFNHPKEITPQSEQAVRALMAAGVIVRNQTVLLRGVNDDAQTLAELLRELSRVGVIPYYIFQCRPVTGVRQQFQVPLLRAYEIVETAKHLQSGQGKCVRFVMSHPTGKIELLGKQDAHTMLMKYHQAKSEQDAGRIFAQELADDQCWL